MLVGRAAECARLDQLLSGVRAGRSAVLVLRGEPGIGKSALLEYAAQYGHGYRIIRAQGVDSEMELPFAGLQVLCAPLLEGIGRLPPPQREALRSAFGLSAGPEANRFLVGLATLRLLSDAAEAQPLLGIVDDAHWRWQGQEDQAGALTVLPLARPHDVVATLYIVTAQMNPIALVALLRHAVSIHSDVLTGVSDLPNGCGTAVRLLGPNSKTVKAAMTAAWNAVRLALLGTPAPNLRKG